MSLNALSTVMFAYSKLWTEDCLLSILSMSFHTSLEIAGWLLLFNTYVKKSDLEELYTSAAIRCGMDGSSLQINSICEFCELLSSMIVIN